jgi:wyosine [tRNA(Phe)-imidazoG37] synthetase (radical SAM superfamily)
LHLSEREVLIGKFKHAAYKPCYWAEQSLRTGGRRQCYKHHFGIKSHQCIQSTSFRGCNIACSFCWRDVEGRRHSFQSFDEPEEIASELIEQQRSVIEMSLPRALENHDNMVTIVESFLENDGRPLSLSYLFESTGISHVQLKDAINDLRNAGVIARKGKQIYSFTPEFSRHPSDSCKQLAKDIVEKHVASRDDIINVHLEAANPKHVAISYDGEPTMYKRIGELVAEFRKRGISTFVVTNGTFPERIREMKEKENLPTQLYVTLAAPERETYVKVCSSVNPRFLASYDHWNRLNETLGLLSALSCRTVIRITAVRGVNMIDPEGYREIVRKANPDFLEVKGFSISGNAPNISRRLGESNLSRGDPDLMKMAFRYSPTHEEVLRFSSLVSLDFSIFPLVSQSELNRQVLMSVGWKDPQRVEIDFAKEL